MTHAVKVELRRFYKMYIEDENNEMSESEVIQKAKGLIGQSEDVVGELLCEDVELPVEPDDVMAVHYGYSF